MLTDEIIRIEETARKAPSKLDEKKIHSMVESFNFKWEPILETLNNDKPAGKTEKAHAFKKIKKYKLAKEKLKSDIIEYMNRWLCIVRRTTGKPNIFEEYVASENKINGFGEKHLVTYFIVRSTTDARAAYEKHAFRIVGEQCKAPSTPMTIWLTHKNSREFDRVDFDPTGDAGDGVYNLFRGLGVPREECIQNDDQAKIFTDHILDIWCNGDQKLCDFLLDFMAHLV